MARPSVVVASLVLATLLALARPVAAQESCACDQAPLPGQVVRVYLKDRWTPVRQGRLLSIDSTALRVRRLTGGVAAPRVIPVDSVRRIDVRVYEGSRTRGALIGAGVGAVAALTAGILLASDSESEYDAIGVAIVFQYGFPVAVTAGALLGALAPPAGAVWKRVR